MSKKTITIITIIGILVVGTIIFFTAVPIGRAMWNNYEYTLQKVDDNTLYETRKEVEDACRAMIASYKTDISTYEIYKDSENEEKQSWAEQARMRANKTANSYNEYILKNSFVWENNVPKDIDSQLAVI